MDPPTLPRPPNGMMASVGVGGAGPGECIICARQRCCARPHGSEVWGNRLSQLLYRASHSQGQESPASPIPDASLNVSESDVESEDNASGDGDPRGHVEDDESDSEESKG